jgi:UDP-N-acetylglucosamine acyltransferase
MNVHPTAIIDPEAEIGVDVTIGPYCVIGPAVVLGEGCWLQNHVTLCGPAKIGSGNRFYAYCSVGQQSQDLKYQGELTWRLEKRTSSESLSPSVGQPAKGT